MFKKVVFAIIAFIIFLALLEGVARLFEASLIEDTAGQIDSPGWQAEFFGKLLDWHEPDPYLLWRFKADLKNPLIHTNSRHFLGPEFAAPKPPQTFRIVILGDSSPVGLGLENRQQTFAYKLRALLQQKYSGINNIEVINTAVPGYSSEQIKIFCERELFKLEPDLVVLYCGNNDASISGYYSDRELLEAQEFKAVRKILGDFAFYRVASSLQSHDNAGIDEKELKIRVTPEEYADNLERITGMCRSQECPLIILKPPVPYLWPAAVQFKIFSHITGEDNRAVMPEVLREVLGRPIRYADGLKLIDNEPLSKIQKTFDFFAEEALGTIYTDSMTLEQAITIKNDIESGNKEFDPVVVNNVGVLYYSYYIPESIPVCSTAYEEFRQGNDLSSPLEKSAGSVFLYNIGVAKLGFDILETPQKPYPKPLYNTFLDSAVQMDYLSLRIKKDYWKAIDKTDRNDNVSIIDLPSIFWDNDNETLFVDHCHPTEAGHTIIAEELYSVIMRKYTP